MQKIPHIHSEIPADTLPVLFALALWEMPLSQSRLLDFLQSSLAAQGVAKKFNAVNIKTSVATLAELGLIGFLPGFGYQATQEVSHAVFLHLLQTNELVRWIREVQEFLNRNREYSTWATPTSLFCQREMLFSVLIDDLPRFGQWRAQFFAFANTYDDLPAKKLFATPAGAQLFTHIKPNLQAQLLIDLFAAASWMLEDCTSAYHYAKEQSETVFKNEFLLMEAICTQAILRGEPDALLQKLIPQMRGASYPLAISKLLKGDFSTSAEIFSIIHTANKQITGKRKLFIPDLAGLFYSAAQLANNTPAHLKLAKEQCDEGSKHRQSQFYPAIKPLIEHLMRGTPLSTKSNGNYHQSLDDFFVRLAYFWQDCPVTETDRRNLQRLSALSQQHGYMWVAAELDQLCNAQFNEPEQFHGWHQAHQLKPLCMALQREEAWQRALSALSQLKTAAQSGADTRIAWFLECESHYVNLEPREQKRSAKGVWSKGRPVALKRLSYEQDSLPGIIEQDKKIATCIKKSYDNYYGGSDYELNGEKALPFLIGHPAVYWLDAPDVKIDILKGEPALTMKQHGSTISLQLEPDMNADEAVIWRKQTPTRLVVYPSNPELKQIAGIIGKGLSVPSNAKEQLVAVIAAIAPHLAIHSDLPELAQHIDSIPADTTLYAHLLPLKEGLRVQFLMRPLPEGSWMTPGKGSVNVLGEHQGKTVQASRSLETEQVQLNAVLKNCPALNQAEQNGQEWEFGHPETCLELLSQLSTFKAESNGSLELVWPEGERFRIKATRSLSQLNLSIKKQGEWFVAGGEIKLDDGKVMALRELLHLVDGATGRFLPLGDNHFLALTDSFKKRLQELNALSEPSGKDGVRVNHLAAPLLAELADEAGDLKADAAWQAQVEKLNSLADYVPKLPSTLQAKLRDYQLEGYQWLSRLAYWGVGACLADDMGLGKTVQTLAVLLERAPVGPALVVAPISVAMNWQAEVARFAPTLRVRAYHQNRSLNDLGAFDLVIASYGMLQQDAEAFAQPDWHTVVLDEAQVIKNSATKRSQAAMALKADFRIIASGTPVENHLGELWNLFRFINPGLLGSKDRFAERFSTPIEKGDKLARSHLKRLIQPFILRRTKTQVLSELPSRTEITLQVELSEQERHMYEALRQESLEKIANMKPEDGKSMQVLAEITKLRRFCCNPKLVMKNSNVAGSKLAVFAEVTEELLDNNHKALVFSQFVDHLAIVRAWLEEKGISYQYLDGSTPAVERKKRVDAFQAGEGDIFLISLKAGGTGLNLTAADYVIHLDPWWNPAVEDQASDRAHRMGQLRPVTIYRLVAQQTIEEKIIALHAQKRDLADSLLEGGDASAKLDTAALLRLLKEGS
ncbi:DEAD/DEAH box helicase [Solimicrobium silvestre]|uniref:SNF2 family N-terminal domain n=1 Tax=Solimicrobium silvestre TaxID=2099400 RepID=A0A2S9GUJ1_9BURK|nr:DEAD/DEAH box helicase [Solimicrobium silvestre]PRC91405.1 SNF2 family N-terminal domain [Solimicrobium silvestre]